MALESLDWSQLSVGVAAIVGLVYVSRTMRRVLDSTLTFIGNHMSLTTQAQEATAEALEDVAASLSTLSERVSLLHADNEEAATALRAADKSVSRLVVLTESERENRLAAELRYARIASTGVRAEGDAEAQHKRMRKGK